MKYLKKLPVPLAFVLIALIFILWVTPYTTNVDNHAASISKIDDKISAVLKLTAGSTAASAAISLLPEDVCTPIAEELAQMAKYFLVVLCALYVEKYLLSFLGYASFGILIPAACLLFIAFYFTGKKQAARMGSKFAVFAVAIYLAIPISLLVSDGIYRTYESKITETIEQTDQISIVNEDESGIEKFLGWIKNAATTIIDYATSLLGKFIETVAVMIVTACVIPILVIVFIVWLVKYLFNINLPVPPEILPPLKRIRARQDKLLIEEKNTED